MHIQTSNWNVPVFEIDGTTWSYKKLKIHSDQLKVK